MSTPTAPAQLFENYEHALEKHGQNHLAVLAPRADDMRRRFTAACELWRNEKNPSGSSLLDLGCGYGGLLDFLLLQNREQLIDYHGVDVSHKMIAAAKARHPTAKFDQRDIIANPLLEQSVDYVIICGVLTVKFDIAHEDMRAFALQLLTAAFRVCRIGIAYNVQNWHVNRRDDLFHWPMDEAASFISSELSANYVFRADFGQYDYMTYVYREPVVK
jgi:SAM-dependent methyltransferase